MKKLLFLFACLFSLQPAVRADDRSIPVDRLPAAAQKFIKKHFSETQVAYATEDKELFSTSYEVALATGPKIQFDGDGQWEKVECKQTSIPAAIVPKAISNYVVQHYKNVRILQIERDTKAYEVELSNGLDLKFDQKFNLINIDN